MKNLRIVSIGAFAAASVRRVAPLLVLGGLLSTGLELTVSAAGNLETALALYRTGETEDASAELDALIQSGSTDPRVYYFRGAIRFASGLKDNASADFETGARFEAAGSTRADIPRALERVQGPARQLLEKYRSEAQRQEQLDAGFHYRDKAFRQMSGEGRTAWLSGNFQKADDLLSRVVENGSKDPRDYYFRGLARQKLGRSDDAAIDFRRATELELNASVPVNVDRALERVQGADRQLLAEIRQPAIEIVRNERRLREREMVARLVKERFGIDLPVNEPGSDAGTAIASRTPGDIPNAPVNPGNPMPAASTTPGTSSAAPGAAPMTTRPGSGTAAASAAKPISLAYLPLDTEVVVYVRVSEIWKSELIRDLQQAEQVSQSVAMMKQMTGLTPADIQSVTIGIADASTLALTASADPTALKEGAKNLGIVIRSRLPINAGLFEQLSDVFEPVDHNGKKFYRSLDPDNAPSVWLADIDVAVLGHEDRVTAAIDDGADESPRPEFQFVDPSRQIAIMFVPLDPVSLTESIPEAGSGSDALDSLAKAVKGQLLGVGLGIGVADSVELEVATMALDETAAGEIGSAVEKLLEEGRGLWNLTRDAVPAPIAGVVDSVLRSMRGQQKNEVYSVSTRVTKQSIGNLVAGAQEMMPMLGGLMMGAKMNGPGGAGAIPGGAFPAVEPVEPPKADRDALNLQISATAKRSDFAPFDENGKQLAPAIELLLDLVGDDAKAAAAAGFAEVTAATDNNGAALNLDNRDAFSTGGFEPVDHDDFFVKHPENGCRVVVKLAPPADAATSIAAAEGRVKLRLIEESKQYVIDNVKSLLGKPLTSAELDAAGYQLSLKEESNTIDGTEFKSWVLNVENASSIAAKIEQMSEAGGLGLQKPEIVAADGSVIASFDGTSSSSFGNMVTFQWSMSLSGDQPIPDDAKIRFRDNTKVAVVNVPFKVENVAIAAEAGTN